MAVALCIALSIVALAITIITGRLFAIAISCRNDDARALCIHFRNLLRSSPELWSEKSGDLVASTGEHLWRRSYDHEVTKLKIGAGDWIAPGWGWRCRLTRDATRWFRDFRHADRLNKISDALEAVMEARNA